MSGTPLAPRDATPADNDALVALSVACPMEGDIGLCVDRAPDFFALNRLEGDAWRVGVVDGPEGRPVGCIAVAERTVHLDGRATPAMYVSDLKVHPDHRGAGVADALTGWARDACVEAQGPDAVVYLTVLGGNRAMQRRMPGPRGLPRVATVATLRTHTVSLLWRRRPPEAGVTVTRATAGDLDEMAALWAAVAPRRQYSGVYDADSLGAWIEAAPDLHPSSYLLARTASGRLAGFVGIWDQSAFKRLRVTGYSAKLAAVRAGYNALAPLVGGARLPPAGAPLRNLTAVHVCVGPEEPAVLRGLLVLASNAHRGQGHSFLNVGLDAADPLAAALRGLHAQTTDIWFCTASLADRPRRREPGGLPVHHEIALV